MASGTKHGFWSGGADARKKALEEERDRLLAPLQDALARTADPRERARLQAEIDRLSVEYAQRIKDADGCWY